MSTHHRNKGWYVRPPFPLYLRCIRAAIGAGVGAVAGFGLAVCILGFLQALGCIGPIQERHALLAVVATTWPAVWLAQYGWRTAE